MKPLIPGAEQFGPQGLDWQDICGEPVDIVTYQIYSLWASLFQRIFFKVLPIISLWELYVAVAIRVPVQPVQKHQTAFPPA